MGLPYPRLHAHNCLSGDFRCSEHISTLKNPGSKRMSAFSRVFGLFSGKEEEDAEPTILHIGLLDKCTLYVVVPMRSIAGHVKSGN